ncbi:hypothetical protein RMATCC62417_10657 [Rhizopus microsporus]|nr:hypothetical protein RMATCC62417_10657 [Rhizopus microsporus]
MPTEEEESNSKSRRPFSSNVPIISDNIKHPMRRDLVLPNFDKNITVEKARFEPTVNDDQQQNDNTIKESTDAPSLNISASTPTITNTNTNNNNNSTTTTSTTISNNNNNNNNPQPSSSEKRRQAKNESSRKKHKKPILHAAASPAEVFHRNLVDAVSNVEDSDENEHYVYPYSGAEGHLTDIQSSGMHRPLSVRSTPSTLFHESTRQSINSRIPTHSKSIGEWLRRAISRQNKPPEEEIEDEEEESYYRRPKLRSTVKDHYTNLDKKGLLSRMQDSFSNKKRTSTYPPTHYYGDVAGGYTSDDEDAPLLRTRQQKRPRPVKNTYRHAIYHSLWISLLFLLCILCIIVYNAKPLMDLNIEIGRVLATDKELIFDLKVTAENWNWWVIHIADADISVFAFSDIVPLDIQRVDPAEYLGSLTHFDEPLSIPSSLHKRKQEAISQIRIKSPGADASGNERWSRIIRYPYGLVVRGVLKYKKVPMYHTQSITICNVTQVNPITGTIWPDPDRTYCLSQDSLY